MSKILYIQNEGANYKPLIEIMKPLDISLVKINDNNLLISMTQINSMNFECIIVDANLGDMDAIKIIEMLYHNKVTLPILTWTLQFNDNFYKEAVRAGAWDYICKTQNLHKNQMTIQNAIKYNKINKKYHNTTKNTSVITIIDEKGRLKNYETLDKEILQTAYTHSKGHISDISRKLNIGRSTLYRKIEKYGIR